MTWRFHFPLRNYDFKTKFYINGNYPKTSF